MGCMLGVLSMAEAAAESGWCTPRIHAYSKVLVCIQQMIDVISPRMRKQAVQCMLDGKEGSRQACMCLPPISCCPGSLRWQPACARATANGEHTWCMVGTAV